MDNNKKHNDCMACSCPCDKHTDHNHKMERGEHHHDHDRGESGHNHNGHENICENCDHGRK